MIEGAVVLHPFLIDVVKAVDANVYENTTSDIDMVVEYRNPQVQIVTYKVLAQNPEHAMRRFFEEEAGVEVYRGDLSDAIVVGMQIDRAGVYNA